ncbi:SxtJ family membrane protein [Candidatus Venteria ishoeyi]|uniref:SxtJ n=1 Tax=Candidatus Venteria ishoeyi TaxID=1899563 RepID=A0A1H6FJL1_9GAMM|nr:SxtJ family membrane protein [Candidatus Venteria ishoeyi]SEH09214.1 Uncharacterised protein [Candidatus Venteria ishoeyi]SEH09339.1 Uncharacterised protein [Candidatus Venteria ishoeyi]
MIKKMNIETPDKKGLREFGLVTGSLFAALFGLFLPWLFGFSYPLWPWVVACIFIAWGLLAPTSMKWLYHAWMSIALVIGWVNTRIILGLMFYLILTPMGLVMRLFGKNPMAGKPKTAASYRNISPSRPPKQMEHPY